MRRSILILLLLLVPVAVLASEQAGEAAHHEKLYFGFIPSWVMKLINMLLFFGVLIWVLKGPIGNVLRDRGEKLQREAEEARERRDKADQMARGIQARLAQIEQDVRAIRERAEVEGERQKRELIAAGEADAAKILQAARNEVENRLKLAKQELTAFAGELTTERAESILKEKITDDDRKKLFQDSLREVGS
jgi:F-type H+-transporting ATPase subunit b